MKLFNEDMWNREKLKKKNIGAILQIATESNQDKIFLSDGDYNPFKTWYNKHTNFYYNIYEHKTNNILDFNKKSCFDIRNDIDLIKWMLLKIEIPQLNAKYENKNEIKYIKKKYPNYINLFNYDTYDDFEIVLKKKYEILLNYIKQIINEINLYK